MKDEQWRASETAELLHSLPSLRPPSTLYHINHFRIYCNIPSFCGKSVKRDTKTFFFFCLQQKQNRRVSLRWYELELGRKLQPCRFPYINNESRVNEEWKLLYIMYANTHAPTHTHTHIIHYYLPVELSPFSPA